jgi:putative peptide zinc metalloprotease protein
VSTAAIGPASGQFKLHANTTVARNSDGTYLVIPAGSPRTLQVGRGFELFVDPLRRGAERRELLIIAQAAGSPATNAGRSLDSLLEALATRGCLEGSTAVPNRDGYYLYGIDRIAKAIVDCARIVPATGWIALLAAAGIIAGRNLCVLAAVATAGLQHGIAHIQAVPLLLAGACNLWLATPVHELAHAVACRAMGQPVSGLVVFARWRTIPAFMVDVRHMLAIRSKWRRALVPAAGPLCDFLVAGSLATMALAMPEGLTRDTVIYMIALLVWTLFMNLNPFTRSDGSWVFSMLLDDYGLPVAALGGCRGKARAGQVWAYRLICLGYVALGVTALAEIVRLAF